VLLEEYSYCLECVAVEFSERFELVIIIDRHNRSHYHLTEHTKDIILIVVADCKVNVVASHHMLVGLEDHA
jgi:hypothetical protein